MATGEGDRAHARRCRVRVYRHGLGDCILVRIPRKDGGRDFTILIDCGVILGTPEPAILMERVLKDVGEVTHGAVEWRTHDRFIEQVFCTYQTRDRSLVAWVLFHRQVRITL